MVKGFLDILGQELGALVGPAGKLPRKPTPYEKALTAASNPMAVALEAAKDGVGGGLDLNQGSPFAELNLDLADTQLPVGKTVNVVGVELYYRREGSSPAARLDVATGGTIHRLYPGQRLKLHFSSLTFILTQGASVMLGTAFARLIVVTVPGASYSEPADLDPLFPSYPLQLAGSMSLNTDVVPGQPNGCPWFRVTGAKKVGVSLGLFGSAVLGSTITLTPWCIFSPAGSVVSSSFAYSLRLPQSVVQYTYQTYSTFPYSYFSFDLSGLPRSYPSQNSPSASLVATDTWWGLMAQCSAGATTWTLLASTSLNQPAGVTVPADVIAIA